MIEPNLSDFMGLLFENVCHEYVKRYWHEKLKIAPKWIGAHWESELEIDLLTENIDGSHWFGECKWWEAPVGENVLNRLIEKVAKLPNQWKQNPRYVLFSAGGFTDTLRQKAENVILIELNDLFI